MSDFWGKHSVCVLANMAAMIVIVVILQVPIQGDHTKAAVAAGSRVLPVGSLEGNKTCR